LGKGRGAQGAHGSRGQKGKGLWRTGVNRDKAKNVSGSRQKRHNMYGKGIPRKPTGDKLGRSSILLKRKHRTELKKSGTHVKKKKYAQIHKKCSQPLCPKKKTRSKKGKRGTQKTLKKKRCFAEEERKKTPGWKNTGHKKELWVLPPKRKKLKKKKLESHAPYISPKGGKGRYFPGGRSQCGCSQPQKQDNICSVGGGLQSLKMGLDKTLKLCLKHGKNGEKTHLSENKSLKKANRTKTRRIPRNVNGGAQGDGGKYYSREGK